MPGSNRISLMFRATAGLKFKSNLHYTRIITPKRVTNDGIHLRDSVPAWATQLRRNVAAGANRWRNCIRFDRPGI